MKEHLLQIKNEQAYFLPFVIFIVLILFSAVTASIQIYRNEILIADNLWEQMKTETLVQMTMKKFSDEKPFIEHNIGIETYHFPSGIVDLSYERITPEIYKITLNIATDKQKNFTIHKRFIYKNEEHEEKNFINES